MSMHKEVALAGCDFIKTVCTVSLHRYYAGCYSKNDTMSVPVSLTRGGIPKIIPTIAVAPKMKKATFQSITTPHSDIDSVREVLGEMNTS
ncbi:hypothetical protein KY285_010726 [Solanum tuberosum]|nr:hypothetical protein KY285_010726 [Solanum tuberosum]